MRVASTNRPKGLATRPRSESASRLRLSSSCRAPDALYGSTLPLRSAAPPPPSRRRRPTSACGIRGEATFARAVSAVPGKSSSSERLSDLLGFQAHSRSGQVDGAAAAAARAAVDAVRARRPGSACVMHYGRRTGDPEDILRAFEALQAGRQAADGSKPRRSDASPKLRATRSDLSELAVDAVRRRWAAEDLAAKGEVAKDSAAAKREKVALRKLVKQLRETRASKIVPTQVQAKQSAQVSGVSKALPGKGSTNSNIHQALTAAVVAASTSGPKPLIPTAALRGPPPILPIAALANRRASCQSLDDGAETLRSRRSDSNSTASIPDDHEVRESWNKASSFKLWASREAIVHQSAHEGREFARPSAVPIIDLSHISELQDEWEEDDALDQNQEGTSVYD